MGVTKVRDSQLPLQKSQGNKLHRIGGLQLPRAGLLLLSNRSTVVLLRARKVELESQGSQGG